MCAVVGEVRADGAMKILGIGDVPSSGVRKGEIIDFELASTCVYNAIRAAEDRADLEIRRVYLSVTGSHITSLNDRGCVRIPEDQREITLDDVKELKKIAREVAIPETNAFLHTHIRHYFVDGQEGVENPVGMCGTQLEADFHLIHGIRTRLQNAIRFVRELPMEVADIVFSPLASAQIMLSRQEKDEGALVIDIGGGTTEVALISLSGIVYSRSVRVAGDELDEAIVHYMKRAYNLMIGERTAEEIKIRLGSAYPIGKETTMDVKGRDLVAGLPKTIIIRSQEVREAMLEPLNTIVDSVRVTLEHCPPELSADLVDRGLVLAGGGALLRGLDKLLSEETGLPVHIAEDPLSAVAEGAGKVLSELEFLKKVTRGGSSSEKR